MLYAGSSFLCDKPGRQQMCLHGLIFAGHAMYHKGCGNHAL